MNKLVVVAAAVSVSGSALRGPFGLIHNANAGSMNE